MKGNEMALEYEKEQLGDDIYLPDCLSELIMDAVEVAPDVDREIYIPDYSAIHQPTAAGKPMQVKACLAGLVMRGRFGASPYGARAHEDFGRNAGRLLALEEASVGNIDVAVVLCDFDFAPEGEELRERVGELSRGWTEERKALVAKYREDPPAHGGYMDWPTFDRFAAAMREVSAAVAAVGW